MHDHTRRMNGILSAVQEQPVCQGMDVNGWQEADP